MIGDGGCLNMINGYCGKLLRINLSTKSWDIENIADDDFEKYLGGSGLGTKILAGELDSIFPSLSPENVIIFATGPFQGSRLPGSAKWVVVSKSPVTNTFSVTAAGAQWGLQLKNAGFDALVINGKSNEKVYIQINDYEIEIKSADHLWGKDAIETPKYIKEELRDDKYSIACIGPAGEKEVAIACIVIDSHSFAGRTGLGAVMGSKNLKAIAVKGTSTSFQSKYSEQLSSIRTKLIKQLSETGRRTRKHGTAAGVISAEASGDLPIKYWSGDQWTKGAELISAPNFTEYLNAKANPCPICPIGCHRKISVEKNGEIIEGAGPEYESLAMLGSCCMIDDLFIIAKANDICNRLGLDTISAGAFVGFCMECYEKEIISDNILPSGPKPVWGNGDFLIKMIQMIGERTGFGEIFSSGIKIAAEKIGAEAMKIAVHVKGLDLPAHDPRAYSSLAINYATGTRGACHLRGFPHCGEMGILVPEAGYDKVLDRFSMEGKAFLSALFQDMASVSDSLVLCIFMQTCGENFSDVTNSYNAITGLNLSPKQLLQIGERIWNLQRIINISDGINRKDDALPRRMFEPAKKGPRKGAVPEPFEPTLNEYYKIRGWDNKGIPTDKIIEKLGLTKFKELLKRSS